MADEKWKHKDLPRANGIIAPAVYDSKKEEWVPLQSPDGNFPTTDMMVAGKVDDLKELIESQESETKKVEVTNQKEFPDVQKVEQTDTKREIDNFPADYPDSAALTELQSMKEDITTTNQKLDDVIDKLNGTLDTQLTGSKVEDLDVFDDKDEILKEEKKPIMDNMDVSEYRIIFIGVRYRDYVDTEIYNTVGTGSREIRMKKSNFDNQFYFGYSFEVVGSRMSAKISVNKDTEIRYCIITGVK